MSRRVVGTFALALLCLAATACAPADDGALATPGPPSGIRGTILVGPTCPAPVDSVASPEPCVTAYSAQLAILDSDGNLVTRVTSAADGHFQVDVPPGDYTIAPQNGDPYPTAPSQPVTVVEGEYVEVQINYDSGIR